MKTRGKDLHCPFSCFVVLFLFSFLSLISFTCSFFFFHLFSSNSSHSTVSLSPITCPVLFHRQRKIKTKMQKTWKHFPFSLFVCLDCCFYVVFPLSLFFICVYFSCSFQTVTVFGLLNAVYSNMTEALFSLLQLLY